MFSKREKIYHEIINQHSKYNATLTRILLQATYKFFSGSKLEFNVYIVGDSQISMMALYTKPKEILMRATQSKVLDLSLTLMSKFPKIRSYFTWVSVNTLLADYNIKIHIEIIPKAKSQFWRQTQDIFLSEKDLQSKSYLQFNAETKSIVALQKLPQHDPKSTKTHKSTLIQPHKKI